MVVLLRPAASNRLPQGEGPRQPISPTNPEWTTDMWPRRRMSSTTKFRPGGTGGNSGDVETVRRSLTRRRAEIAEDPDETGSRWFDYLLPANLAIASLAALVGFGLFAVY